MDSLDWDYDVATPYEQPLGGSQSALCYLAAELARRQSQVTLYCGTSSPRDVMGVKCVSARDLPLKTFRQPFDAIITLNAPADDCLQLRPYLALTTPLVLWTQLAFNSPLMLSLQRPEVRDGWDAIVCVSEWHRSTLIEHYGVDPARVIVRRNAIAPPFEGLFQNRDELASAKGLRLLLCYTSTPYRGLDVLVDAFPSVRAEFADAQLAVFSSMKVYQQNEPDDAYRALYERCRSTPGVRYVGSLSQARLAEELKSVSVLAYPNTFAETSCIAVMEALAAGLYVITADRGALAETAMGFGTLVPPVEGKENIAQFARDYLHTLKLVLRQRALDPASFAAARFEQVQAINASCTWRIRAAEWEESIRDWKRARG